MLPEIEQFQKWLRRKAPHASTPIHYTSDLLLFFDWSGKNPGQITVKDVDHFIEYCEGLHHAVTTINRRLNALRAFYHFLAIESASAPTNPVLPRRHFIRLGTRLPRDVEDDVLAQLFAVIHSPRDQAMFILMLRCGLRVGEVRRLGLPDLYLQPVLDMLPRIWLHGKGGGQRVAYLSPQTLTALQRWLDVRPESKDPAVFLNRFGRQLTVTGIQDRLAHYCREAGLWLTCHQFRHTFGRQLIEARVPVTTIQRLLGHKQLATTQIYLNISDPQVQEDYEAAMAKLGKEFPLEDLNHD